MVSSHETIHNMNFESNIGLTEAAEDMLRRKRAGEDTPQVNRAIAATISGISAGLRNTG